MSKKCAPLWREAHFQVKSVKNWRPRTTFWKLRCRKSAHRCGAKHISKSKMYKTHQVRTTFRSWDVEKVHVVARSTFPSQKCTKHHMFAPLLEVQMSKKCTSLWREAHFKVKMLKSPGVRTTFGSSDVASLRFTTLHYITLDHTPLHYTTLHYTTLHNTTTTTTQLHSTTLHYIKLHYTTLHALHSTTLRYITLHYTTLHYTTIHWMTLHHR